MNNAFLIRIVLILLFVPACSAISLKSSKSTPHVSDVKSDEHVVFFRTAASFDEKTSQWRVPIHGWIYEPEDSKVRKALIEKTFKLAYDLEVSAATQKNFDRRVNLLMSDNEGGNRIIIRMAGREFELPESHANGHFKSDIMLNNGEVKRYAKDSLLEYSAVLKAADKRQFKGQVKLVSPRGISVISDIDDTVKISMVTDHKKLFDYTFYQDFIPAPGMPALYAAWAKQGGSFHFVSSSPWHLYSPLMEFTVEQGFPWATFSLKMIRLKDETIMNLFKKGTETKPKQIEPILQRYPQRKFILVGDSGEQDPEVYAGIIRKYPQQIVKILIRNVTQESASAQRFQQVFAGLSRDKWQLFNTPADIDIKLATQP